ncbi:hypothetical protein T08_90 [Trichinella sp. T8]|nr:hypothetical protein T08_90 [Trichinella sp. T8]
MLPLLFDFVFTFGRSGGTLLATTCSTALPNE